MRKIIFIIAIPFILFSCGKKEEISVEKVAQQLKKYHSFSYKATEKYFYSNAPDTIVTPFEVWAIRDNNDTLREGYVWVDNKYRPYHLIYEESRLFLVIPPKKTTLLYSNYTEPLISSIDWIDFFLKPRKLLKLASDPNVSIIFSDVSYKGKACSKMEMSFSKNKKVYEKQIYYLDTKSMLPLFAKQVRFKKEYTYTGELFFTHYQFDKVDINVLKEMRKQLVKENRLERAGDSKTSRLEKMLHVGDKAPVFSGKDYATGKKVSLADYIGKKVIIVDFWYTHCPPCVRAMPYLSDLYKEYKDKGLLILGVNSVDYNSRSKQDLDNFLGKRNISYPIILTIPSTDMMYRINGYPTMYVIDLDGKIAYVEMGFDPESFNELKEKIEDMLP